MHDTRHHAGHRHIGTLLICLAMVALTATACGDDFGTECSLPDNDAVREACAGTGTSDQESNTSSSASCVVENIIECDSRICARYRGSKPFCTKTCSSASDSSCPDGAFCAEYVVGTEKFYCVKAAFRDR